MLQSLLIVLGVLLLIRAGRRIVRGEAMPPTELCLLTWGLVTFFAGIDFVRYYPITTLGFSTVVAAVAGTWVISRKMARPKADTSIQSDMEPTLPPWLITLTQLAAVLVIIGLVGRVYHTGIVNNRGLSLDIGERYLAGREESQRSVGAILAWLTGFWVLPMGVVMLFFRQLSLPQRLLFLFSGAGHALNVYYLGGRTGIGLGAMSFVGLYLSGAHFRGRRQSTRLVNILPLGLFVAVVLILLGYLFERRFRVTQDQHRYSQIMDINQAYAPVMQVLEKSGLAEAVIGSVGYLGSPVQQWSMYLELGLEARLAGAFNLDVPAMVLRKTGFGERHYAVNMSEIMETYENIANAPLGTFSTVLRDLHLDFGWWGVLIGFTLSCVLGDFAYQRVISRQLEFVPLVTVWFGIMGFNPITSGLTISGTNQGLLAAIACWWVIRAQIRRRSGRRRLAPLLPAGAEPAHAS